MTLRFRLSKIGTIRFAKNRENHQHTLVKSPTLAVVKVPLCLKKLKNFPEDSAFTEGKRNSCLTPTGHQQKP